jgi:tetratricopeptide (TPR) repeat protein
MADKGAILKNAQAFTAKGLYDKAIAEWLKLRADSPGDGTISNTIGDLHLKRNATRDAIDAFYEAAAAFRTAGDALKAIALYKKILKLDARQFQAYQAMGDLNAQRGLITSAVQDYLTLAKLYQKEGKAREAHACYGNILKLDPAHAEAARQFEELCRQHHLPSEIGDDAHEGAPPARSPARKGTGERRAESPEAEREALLTRIAQQIERGDLDEAESALMGLLSQEPGSSQVIRPLAIVHIKKRDLTCARGEVHYLADAALRERDFGTAESLLKEYLAADACYAPMVELLGKVFEQKEDDAAAAAQYGKAIELLLQAQDSYAAEHAADLYIKLKALAPSGPQVRQFAAVFDPASQQVTEPAASDATAAAEPEQRRDYEAHYEVGLAYRNMGLLDEAIEELQVSMRADEYFLDSCRWLATCFKEHGKTEPAIRCLEQAIKDPRCQGEKSMMIRYDLGLLYESEGRLDRAREVLSTIPTFLDVPARLQRIDEAAERPA